MEALILVGIMLLGSLVQSALACLFRAPAKSHKLELDPAVESRYASLGVELVETAA